jgi:murein DD-endopeptidase MepM/ murein hydrolase activator NlpD
MANKKAGKIKRPPSKVSGAVTPDGLSHLTAAISVGSFLKLTVRDCRTLLPVAKAPVKSIDVSYTVQSSEGSFRVETPDFDFPSDPPPYESPFTEADENSLTAKREKMAEVQVTLGEVEQLMKHATEQFSRADSQLKATAETVGKEWEEKRKAGETRLKRNTYKRRHEAFKREEKDYKIAETVLKETKSLLKTTSAEYSKLVQNIATLWNHREARKSWVQYLKLLLNLHKVWDASAIDGVEDENFRADVQEAYHKALGYWPGWRRESQLVTRLHENLARRYITDNKGVLIVPLPIGASGSIRIEMKHLKLLELTNTRRLLPPNRVDFDWNRIGADDPHHLQAQSGWKLVRGEDEAYFRNYLELNFDTHQSESASRNDYIDIETVALVWCQPVWTRLSEHDYLIEPGEMMGDGRGLHKGHPTLAISTTAAGSAKGYGIYGRDRTRFEQPHYRELTVEIEGQWYTWEPTWEVEQGYLPTLEEARRWIERTYSSLVDRREREVARVGRLLSQDLTLSPSFRFFRGGGFLNLDPTAYGLRLPELKLTALGVFFVVRTKKFSKPKNKEDAELEVANRWGESRKKSVTAVPVPGEPGRMRWRVRFLNARGKEGLEYEEIFDHWDDVKSLLKHRMHQGIDIAGKVGDPVFAPVGGTIDGLTKKPRGVSGFVVTVRPWIRDPFVGINLLHNDEYICSQGMSVKAGDQVAKMGRTGNPGPSSPTHVHFQAYELQGKKWIHIDYRKKILGVHSVVIPHNKLPKMLPCAGQYGVPPKGKEASTEPRDSNLCGVRVGDLQADRTWANCWAMEEKTCPYAYDKGKLNCELGTEGNCVLPPAGPVESAE